MCEGVREGSEVCEGMRGEGRSEVCEEVRGRREGVRCVAGHEGRREAVRCVRE